MRCDADADAMRDSKLETINDWAGPCTDDRERERDPPVPPLHSLHVSQASPPGELPGELAYKRCHLGDAQAHAHA